MDADVLAIVERVRARYANPAPGYEAHYCRAVKALDELRAELEQAFKNPPEEVRS